MFELYDSLVSIPPNPKVSLETLKTAMIEMDREGQTYLFALIYYHAQKSGLPLPPFQEQVVIDLTTLSKDLIPVLYKFTQMHKQRMSEQLEMVQAQKMFIIKDDS